MLVSTSKSNSRGSRVMRRFLSSVSIALLTLSMRPPPAGAALICKNGFLHYGGSGFYAQRLQAEASAIEAWRRIKARSVGAERAATMFPPSEQMQCAPATRGEG